eukprot:TRINITY_DN4209_c0_g1_i1.p1 TRINITY_DN4209_c0_g1~~TRINITY_DN4209_c0_g1_i1.p1  ORF type:complete len:554 (+),score=116.36 TRINITY_DN4209_c0_g1_i1:936-2597(+)
MQQDGLNSKLISKGVFILGRVHNTKEFQTVFTEDCLLFVAQLHRTFEKERKRLMSVRSQKLNEIQGGKLPCFNPATRYIRTLRWQVDEVPECLKVRKVDVVCLDVANKKVLDVCIASSADGIQVDFDDGFSPTWKNVILSQVNLFYAVRESLVSNAKETPLLIIRPRSLHLPEFHMIVDGENVCGAFFDFGVFWYHNAKILSDNARGPFFYLPKIEGYEEAKLWDDIFVFSQDKFGIPIGTTKAIVLIENLLAAFEMDEILYSLRHHIVGLNTGKFDYIASFIRVFSKDERFVLPERSALGANQEFLYTYNRLLVSTCHRRKAYATGGMAPNLPKKDESKWKLQEKSVFESKLVEAKLGFDGALVASVDFAQSCRKAFDEVIGSEVSNQIRNSVLKEHPHSEEFEKKFASSLLAIPTGDISEKGLFQAVQVSLFYIEAWMRGKGTIVLDGVVEDLATAEICRSLVWQWVRYIKPNSDESFHIGSPPNIPKQIKHILETLIDEKITKASDEKKTKRWKEASRLFFLILNSEQFLDFMPNLLSRFIAKAELHSKL